MTGLSQLIFLLYNHYTTNFQEKMLPNKYLLKGTRSRYFFVVYLFNHSKLSSICYISIRKKQKHRFYIDSE